MGYLRNSGNDVVPEGRVSCKALPGSNRGYLEGGENTNQARDASFTVRPNQPRRT
jgi:hypothetical protein